MKIINLFFRHSKLFLAAFLCSQCTMSLACSPQELTDFQVYQQRGNQLIYASARPESWYPHDGSEPNKIVSILDGIDLKNFHRVGYENTMQGWWEDTTPEAHQAHYFTDGQYIIFEGKIIRNAPNEPAVDAKTFVQPAKIEALQFTFAFDQHSTYSNGKRAGDNPSKYPIHEGSLTTVPAPNKIDYFQNILFLRDSNSLFNTAGKYLGGTAGLEQIASSTTELDHCTHTYSVIYRTDDLVLLDDNKIEADPDTFQIIGWTPGYPGWLRYRDKNGEHQFPKSAEAEKTADPNQPGWGVNNGNYCAYGASNKTVTLMFPYIDGTKTDWFYCQTQPPVLRRPSLLIAGAIGLLLFISGLIFFIKRKSRSRQV